VPPRPPGLSRSPRPQHGVVEEVGIVEQTGVGVSLCVRTDRTPSRAAQHGVVELVLVVLHVRLLPSAPQP
jgi:hypothetical protein